MSVQFGIVTTADGIGAVILQGANTSDTIQTAEALDEHGNVIAINGYGRKTGGSFNALLDGEVTAKAGDVVTVGGESKILTAVTRDNVEIELTGNADAKGSAGTEKTGSSGVVTDGALKVKIGRQINGAAVDLVKAGADAEAVVEALTDGDRKNESSTP